MRITIKLFAIIRDRAGMNELTMELPPNATVAQLSTHLIEKFPQLEMLLKHVAYAVNQSYVPCTTELHDGDELAIIPPVSGG